MDVKGKDKVFYDVASILNSISTGDDRNYKMIMALDEHKSLSHKRNDPFMSYEATLNILVDTSHNFEAKLLVQFYGGGKHELTLQKIEGTCLDVHIKSNKGTTLSTFCTFDAFKECLESNGDSAFLHLLARIEKVIDEFRVSERYHQEAEELLDYTYINYCLDNRRYDLLQELFNNKGNVHSKKTT